MSNREALIAIISIAQHAKPNVIGQMEFFRPQLITESSVVSSTLSCRSLLFSASILVNKSEGAVASSFCSNALFLFELSHVYLGRGTRGSCAELVEGLPATGTEVVFVKCLALNQESAEAPAQIAVIVGAPMTLFLQRCGQFFRVTQNAYLRRLSISFALPRMLLSEARSGYPVFQYSRRFSSFSRARM